MKIILSEEQLRKLIKEEMDEPLGIRLKNLRKLKHRLNNYTDSGYVDRNPWSDRDGPDTIDDTTTSYKEDDKNHLRNLERNHVIVGINRNIEYYTQMIDMIFRQVKTGKYPKYTWAGELKDYKKDIQDYRDKIEKEREKLRKYLETNTIQESSSKTKDDVEEMEIDEAKHKPTNSKLWASCLAWARTKYKVCPSAYCNGAATKRYNSKGGKWKTVK